MWESLSARLFLTFSHIAASWFESRAKTAWPLDSHLHVVAYKTNETSTIGIYAGLIPSPLLLLVLPLTKQAKRSTWWLHRLTIWPHWVNFGNPGEESGEETKTPSIFNSQEPHPQSFLQELREQVQPSRTPPTRTSSRKIM